MWLRGANQSALNSFVTDCLCFMKYAVIGDIHGNLEALDAVLEDAESQGVDEYVSVGDIVGYNANPRECLKKLRDIGCLMVKGNHDHYCSIDTVLNGFNPLAAKVIRWTREQLSEEEKKFLSDLPYKRRVANFTIVHSTLDMPEKWGYVFDRYEADANFTYQRTAVCFYGHTHVPLAFERDELGDVCQGRYTTIKIMIGRKYFVNTGSVGQPRDGDPRASYGIYDLDERQIELRRLEYDRETAQNKVLAAGLPKELALRLELGQ